MFNFLRTKESAPLPHIDTMALNSGVIRKINTVYDGFRTLKEDHSPSTMREIVHRTVKSFGQETLNGKLSYSEFEVVEKGAQEFFTNYYLQNDIQLKRFLEAIQPYPLLRVENINRNLAAPFWEDKIKPRVFDLVNEHQNSYNGANTTVVSVAWGASEPSLLLSGLLEAPLTHVKVENNSLLVLQEDSKKNNPELIYVMEDVTRTGRSLQTVVDYVSSINPGVPIIPSVIHDYGRP